MIMQLMPRVWSPLVAPAWQLRPFSCPLLLLLIPLRYFFALVFSALVQFLFCFVFGRRFHGISLPRVAILLPWGGMFFRLDSDLPLDLRNPGGPPWPPRGSRGLLYGRLPLACAEVQFDGRFATHLNLSPADSIHGLPSPLPFPFTLARGLVGI